MLLLLFIGIPLLEIYLFIQVGSAIGAGLTIFLIVFTAIVGVVMLKAQSLATLARFRQSLNRDGMVGYELFEGTFLIIGGALLLTPGFFTDVIGFLCLARPSRLWLIRTIIKNQFFGFTASSLSSSSSSSFIEGSYRRYDDDDDDDNHHRT